MVQEKKGRPNHDHNQVLAHLAGLHITILVHLDVALVASSKQWNTEKSNFVFLI